MSDTTNSTELPYEQTVLVNLELGAYALTICIIILLTCLERNQKGSRPGVVIPVDLLKDDKLTYVYAAAFGCTSSSIVQLIMSVDIDSFSVSPNVKPWVQIPFLLLLATIAALKYYPIFASIGNTSQCVGTVIGFIYCGYLLGQILYHLIEIEIQNEDFSVILTTVPLILCYVFLLYHFIHRAVMLMRKYVRKRNDAQNTKLVVENNIIQSVIGYEIRYVKWLLHQNEHRLRDTGNVDRVVYRKIKEYRTSVQKKLDVDTHLKTSPRVISTFVVCGMILLQLGISFCLAYQPVRKLAMEFVSDNFVNSTFIEQIKLFSEVMDVSFYLSFTLSTIMMGVYIILIYRSYQKDLRKMYHGDFSFLPKKVRRNDNKNLVAASLRYSGIQIAYMFWCYLILFISILFLCFALAYLLILPLMKKVPDQFLSLFKTIVPAFLARYIFHFLQSLLVDRFFLQNHTVKKDGSGDEQRVIALKNRKMFSVLTYFMFFFHVIIGFVDSINRILLGAAIGILTVARIDRSLMPRGYEHLDHGYSNYVGLIMLELYHRNPILVVFCDEIVTSLKQRSNITNVTLEAPEEHTGYQRRVSESIQERRRKQIRNRWQKAYTLVNNPSLRHTQKDKRNKSLIYYEEMLSDVEA